MQTTEVTEFSAEALISNLENLRTNAPLVQNITNFVVMQQTANALLAIGASPVMAHAKDELAELAVIAQSLVINIGTLDEHWISSMLQAAKIAKKNKIPVVLDPVGAGASKLRTQTALQLLTTKTISVLRANAGEIMALAGEQITSKGVDSQYGTDSAVDAAKLLSNEYKCVVVISGEQDQVIQGSRQLSLANGVAMQTKVTGMGCTATALCGAFCALSDDYFTACASAMSVMGIAAEIAFEKSQGPGSLQVNFLDTLYNLKNSDLSEQLKIV